MSNSLVHVRIGAELKRSMNELVKSGLFSNQAELVRESIRTLVTDYYRRRALANLPKQRGILKWKGKGLTREIRNKLAMDLTPEKSEQLLREYGFR